MPKKLTHSELEALLNAIDHPELINESIVTLANSDAGQAFQEEIERKHAARQLFDAAELKLKEQQQAEAAHLLLQEDNMRAQKEEEKYARARLQRYLNQKA